MPEKEQFDKLRDGTGTREWAEVTEAICLGCSNNCRYCFAAANAKRFKTKPRNEWHIEELTKRADMTSYPAKHGIVMFPSSHDITPFNLDACIKVLTLILDKGNQVLIVTKPSLKCMPRLLNDLKAYRDQILFRFTIGSMNDEVSKFWEPGAPLPKERVRCLADAKAAGFLTSVSMEPMLDGVLDALAVLDAVKPFVTETIWIGKMNKPRLRVDMSDPTVEAAVSVIERKQSDPEIWGMVCHLSCEPKVRWKDSIKSVIAILKGT